MNVELIATAAFGVESVVAREVKMLGYQEVHVENGRVTFLADTAAICRANLWLRSSDRVLVKLGQFPATTFDELFDQTRMLPWADWLPADANFPVEGRSIASGLYSVSDCQAIVKKAVVEAMKERYHAEWFSETGPRCRIEVALRKDIATLTLDTTGAGLHKRGYRRLAGPAPVKETLAAAIIMLSRWRPDQPLLDPLCGTGTIPIEAALIGRNIAPGLHRSFAAEAWPVVPKAEWQEAWQEALDLAEWNRPLDLAGSDIDPAALDLARQHAHEARLEGAITWRQQPVAELQPRLLPGPPTTAATQAGTAQRPKGGYIICNPPYGERLGEHDEVAQLYREMGRAFRNYPEWACWVLSSHPAFERLFGRRADKKRKLYNGKLECTLMQFNPASRKA